MTPQNLLAAIDADAPLAQRHLWLMDTLRWVRGDASDVIGAVARMRALIEALEADPALREEKFAELRRMAANKDLARDFLVRSSMIWSVRRAAEVT